MRIPFLYLLNNLCGVVNYERVISFLEAGMRLHLLLILFVVNLSSMKTLIVLMFSIGN